MTTLGSNGFRIASENWNTPTCTVCNPTMVLLDFRLAFGWTLVVDMRQNLIMV